MTFLLSNITRHPICHLASHSDYPTHLSYLSDLTKKVAHSDLGSTIWERTGLEISLLIKADICYRV